MTWRPDGGPEAIRETFEFNHEVLARFRAHRISGGHQKWPDQAKDFDGDWYRWPSQSAAEGRLRSMRDKCRAWVGDKALFDRLCADDGRCGAAEWYLDGQRVTSTSIWSAYYTCRILELCPDARTVVDLGGGYGHLAEMLAEFFPRVILVDLPICLRLAGEYTTRVDLAAPEGEWDGDLLVNTMSMQHMTPANLDYYGQRITEGSFRHLYLVNRTTKRDPTDTPIDDYPFLPLFEERAARMIGKRHKELFAERRDGCG